MSSAASSIADQYNRQALVATQQIFAIIKEKKATLKQKLPKADCVITIAVNTINAQNRQEKIEVAALRFDNRPEKGSALGVSVCLYRYQDRVITQVDPEEDDSALSNDHAEQLIPSNDPVAKSLNTMRVARAIDDIFLDGIAIPQTDNVVFSHVTTITNDNQRLERVIYAQEEIQKVNPNNNVSFGYHFQSPILHEPISIKTASLNDGNFKQLNALYHEMLALSQGKMSAASIQKRFEEERCNEQMLSCISVYRESLLEQKPLFLKINSLDQSNWFQQECIEMGITIINQQFHYESYVANVNFANIDVSARRMKIVSTLNKYLDANTNNLCLEYALSPLNRRLENVNIGIKETINIQVNKLLLSFNNKRNKIDTTLNETNSYEGSIAFFPSLHPNPSVLAQKILRELLQKQYPNYSCELEIRTEHDMNGGASNLILKLKPQKNYTPPGTLHLTFFDNANCIN